MVSFQAQAIPGCATKKVVDLYRYILGYMNLCAKTSWLRCCANVLDRCIMDTLLRKSERKQIHCFACSRKIVLVRSKKVLTLSTK